MGRNGTAITLSNHILSITLVCSVKNIVDDTEFGPALPSPTYVWKKNGITLINENGFTENFTTLYFQMWKLTSIPVLLLNGNNITIIVNTVGWKIVPYHVLIIDLKLVWKIHYFILQQEPGHVRLISSWKRYRYSHHK